MKKKSKKAKNNQEKNKKVSTPIYSMHEFVWLLWIKVLKKKIFIDKIIIYFLSVMHIYTMYIRI